MEKSRVDSELLIAAIKMHECIWNKDSKDYHKKGRKEDSWNQICEELIDDWNDLTEDEKINKQYELKKRWSNIRDYYKKDLALQLSGKIGQPSMKRQKYVFSKHLEFLRPFLDVSCNTRASEDYQEEEQEVYLEALDSSDSESSLPLKRKSITVKNLEAMKSFNTTEVATENNESLEDDCDFLFLKSLVPDMNVMTREQKIDFKMGVLQLYKNIMSENRYCEVYYDVNMDTKNPLK